VRDHKSVLPRWVGRIFLVPDGPAHLFDPRRYRVIPGIVRRIQRLQFGLELAVTRRPARTPRSSRAATVLTPAPYVRKMRSATSSQ
jgi:hypothetical protein